MDYDKLKYFIAGYIGSGLTIFWVIFSLAVIGLIDYETARRIVYTPTRGLISGKLDCIFLSPFVIFTNLAVIKAFRNRKDEKLSAFLYGYITGIGLLTIILIPTLLEGSQNG